MNFLFLNFSLSVCICVNLWLKGDGKISLFFYSDAPKLLNLSQVYDKKNSCFYPPSPHCL